MWIVSDVWLTGQYFKDEARDELYIVLTGLWAKTDDHE